MNQSALLSWVRWLERNKIKGWELATIGITQAMNQKALDYICELSAPSDRKRLAGLSVAIEKENRVQSENGETQDQKFLLRTIILREFEAILGRPEMISLAPMMKKHIDYLLKCPDNVDPRRRICDRASVKVIARWFETMPPIARIVIQASDERFATSSDTAAMKTLVERLVHLRSVPLFANVAPEVLLILAQHTVEIEISQGETLFKQGDRGNELYVLLEGQLGLSKEANGNVVELTTLSAGACLGEVALFDGYGRSATAIAKTPCRLLALEGSAIETAGRRSPQLYEALLRVLAQRLRQSKG